MITGYQADKLSGLLLNFIKIAVLAILALPLVVMQGFAYPFMVPRSAFFHIIIELALFAYLVLAFLKPEYRPTFRKSGKIAFVFLIFVLVSAISGFLGIGFFRSFWSDLSRMQGIFHLIHLLIFLMVIVAVFKNIRQWHSFMIFSIVVSFIVSASILIGILAAVFALAIPFERFSFWFVLSKADRLRFSGTLGNASFLAAYLLPNLFFTIYFIVKKQALGIDSFFENFIEKYSRLIYYVLGGVFFVNFLVFFKTQTRSSLLGFVAGLIFLIIVGLFLQKNFKSKALGSLFFIIIILAPIFLFLAKDSQLVQGVHTLRRLSAISLTDLTTASRFLTWQTAWQGLTQSPKTFLLGYGPENFYYVFNKNFPVSIYKDAGSQVWFDRAHSMVFDVGVTTGIIGLISYTLVFVLAVYYLLKQYIKTGDKSLMVFISFLIAYAVQSLFTFDTINNEIPLFLLLGFISFIVTRKDNNVFEQKTNLQYFYPYAGLFFTLLLVPVIINLKIFELSSDIFKADIAHSNSLVSLEESYSVLLKKSDQPFTGKFLVREQLANFVADSSNQQLPMFQIRDKVATARVELAKSMIEEIKNAKHYVIFNQFLQDTAKLQSSPGEEIIKVATAALELSPNRPQIYFQLAQGYAFMKDFPQAYESFIKGISLAPWVIEDRWALLDLVISFKEEDIFQKEWARMQQDLMWNQESSSFVVWQPVVADYRRLADLYGQNKNYLKAIEFYNVVIDLEPTGLDYAKLAAYYAKMGSNKEAEEATKEAVRLYPGLFEESKRFLELLENGELIDKDYNK